MRLNTNSSNWKKVHWLATACSSFLVVLFMINIHPVRAANGGAGGSYALADCYDFSQRTTSIPQEVDKLCGRLVIIKDLEGEKYYIGLEICGSAQILIFQTRPRELLKFYQFSEVRIGRGTEISTEWGKFNQFIVNFESYIPIDSCNECGKIVSPTPRELVATPAGTQSLVFPTATTSEPTATYTRTPVPSATFTSVTPSLQPTETRVSPTVEPDETRPTASDSTPPTPTIQRTPPPGDNPADLPDNSGFILSGVAVAFIVTLGVGVFYLRRKMR